MQNKILTIVFFSAAVASTLLPGGCGPRAKESVTVQNDSIPPMGFWPDSLDAIEETVRRGETFTGLMVRLGMSHDEAFALAQACDSVFDVTKMRAGNAVRAYFGVDTTKAGTDSTEAMTLRYVVYEQDKAGRTIFKTTSPLSAWNYSKPVEVTLEYSDITITSSLWKDMLAAGVSPLMIVSLSEIYAWSVDFFALQEGDRFKVLYEQARCDEDIIAVDTIYYAEFIRDEKILPAIMFDQGDGGNRYWNGDGESLKKAFLKAPLKFTRISSGFSYHRRHPVTGKVRPHTAVDYAAPVGTPVMTIGDGTVLSAGWTNGGGKTVRIRHMSGYETSYMHLSRFAKGIVAGRHVSQGDLIGYVGSTGMSTGPHLDFRVYQNGKAINPLKLAAPSADPIRPENKPALDSVLLSYRAAMDSLANGKDSETVMK